MRSCLLPAGCALALSLPLGGCLTGYEKPEAALDVPPAYKMARGDPDIALPTLTWWRGFKSGQLTNLIEESLASNLDIAAAVARVVQADAQARIAGAPLLPTVNYNASATRSRTSQSTVASTGSSSGSERTLYSTSFSASYEIDFWGKNRAATRAAEENAVASRFDRETVTLTTVAAVANAYFQVLAAQDRLRVAQENVRAAVRVLKLTQERLQAGTASALETSQQESVVANQRAAIPLLEIALRQNIFTLAVLIGRAPESVVIPGGSMYRVAIPPVTPGLPSDLLVQRPDIRFAEAQLAAANANVEFARAAMLPSIQLTGEGGFQSAVLRTLLRPESAFYTVTAGLTQPIFDGGRLLGQLDQNRGRQDELLQNYRKAVVNAFSDVDKALIAVQQQAERERLQRQVVKASREAFQISETRLREGTVDLVTVLNTQLTLFQAEDVLAQVRLARLLAVVSLYQALGGGWRLPVDGPPGNL